MKILLFGSNYYKRIYDPLKALGHRVFLIRYDYLLPSILQPFAHLVKMIRSFFIVITRHPDCVVYTNPSYIAFFTTGFFKMLNMKTVMRVGADLSNDFKTAIQRKKGLKKFFKALQHRLYASSIRRVDRILTSSEYVKTCIGKGYGIPERKMFCIYTPVTVHDVDAVKSGKIILSVTQFNNPLKAEGLKDAVRHLAVWLRKHPDVTYVIVGGGKNFQPIRDWIESEINLSNITFTGLIQDVTPWYEKAACFIHISYRDGFPKSVIEALSYGLPVIANDDVGMKEQVEHGYNGFLIANDQIHILQKFVDVLLKDPEQLNIMSKNSADFVASHFSLEAVAGRLSAALSS